MNMTISLRIYRKILKDVVYHPIDGCFEQLQSRLTFWGFEVLLSWCANAATPKRVEKNPKAWKNWGKHHYIIILESLHVFFFPVALLLMLSLGAVETPQISRWRFRAGLFHRHRGTMKTNDIAMKALSLGGLKRYHHESRVYHVCWHHYLIQARVGKIDEHGTLLTCLLQPF